MIMHVPLAASAVACAVKWDGITYRWDELRYDEFYVEAQALIRPHWREVGTFRNILHLNPDHDRYRRLEAMGALHILIARDRGEIVGYFTVLLTPHARDRHALVGSYDNLYAAPPYRRQQLGLRLQEEGMRKLEELGAHILMFGERFSHSGKAGRRGGYLKRYGFVPVETMYAKLLRDPHGDTQ